MNGWKDVIGEESEFGVYGINTSRSDGRINFDLYTNFNGSYSFTTQSDNTKYNFYLADFAIDSNQSGVFNYGVVLRDHRKWSQSSGSRAPTAGDLDVGLYSVNGWDTSEHFFEESHNVSTGGIGYGDLYNIGYSVYLPVVAIASGSLVRGVSVNRTHSTGMNNPYYVYSFSINASDINAVGKPFNVFWGGADCSNDAIYGTVPVPEPATIVLLISGLLVMAGVSIKKQKYMPL
ncbi:PEP-CTERM sorting domain-containing protein [Desulfobacterota bacterium M19]